MKRTTVAACLLLGIFAGSPAAWAGRDAPIQNLVDTPTMWMPGVEPTAEKLSRAIIAACVKLGWVCQVASPGEITGRLNLRSHEANVRITYTAEKYSIYYVSSTNLRYNAEENTIHRNYNNWVLNLQRHINSEVASIP
jgi:hypothetical protein